MFDNFDIAGASLVEALSAPNPFDVDLVAHLNPLLSTAVYPGGKIPQQALLPAYTFFLVSEEPRYRLKGAAGLTAKTYQFSCLSLRYLDPATMELSLRNALHGFTGLMGGSYVSSCRLQNVMDLPYEAGVGGKDQGTYQRVVEYRILIRESVPQF